MINSCYYQDIEFYFQFKNKQSVLKYFDDAIRRNLTSTIIWVFEEMYSYKGFIVEA